MHLNRPGLVESSGDVNAHSAARSDIYHTIKMLIRKRQICTMTSKKSPMPIGAHHLVRLLWAPLYIDFCVLAEKLIFLHLEWTERTDALKQLTCIPSMEVPICIIIHCGPMMDNTPTLCTDTIQAGSLATLSIYTAEKDVGAGCRSVYFSISANCLEC